LCGGCVLFDGVVVQWGTLVGVLLLLKVVFNLRIVCTVVHKGRIFSPSFFYEAQPMRG
jgi:hypothetical protein